MLAHGSMGAAGDMADRMVDIYQVAIGEITVFI
jgi:hypothetical protein